MNFASFRNALGQVVQSASSSARDFGATVNAPRSEDLSISCSKASQAKTESVAGYWNSQGASRVLLARPNSNGRPQWMLEDLYSKSQERRQALYRPCSHLSSLCIVSCLPCTHVLQTTPGRCITSAGHASMHHLVLMKHEACDWMSHSHQMPDCFNSTASVIDNQCTSKEGSKPLDAKGHLTPSYLCASGICLMPRQW